MSDARDCKCASLGALAVIDMGEHEDVLRSFDRRRERGGAYWWLYASTCRVCGSTWLIAQEERQNDVFILKRLDGETADRLLSGNAWPADLDRYETLLEIGLAHGRRVRFVDVLDSSLPYTMADLAREHPGISVSRLALLLNLPHSTATDLARAITAKEGVKIAFDA